MRNITAVLENLNLVSLQMLWLRNQSTIQKVCYIQSYHWHQCFKQHHKSELSKITLHAQHYAKHQKDHDVQLVVTNYWFPS
jgi:hypothetical protein